MTTWRNKTACLHQRQDILTLTPPSLCYIRKSSQCFQIEETGGTWRVPPGFNFQHFAAAKTKLQGGASDRKSIKTRSSIDLSGVKNQLHRHSSEPSILTGVDLQEMQRETASIHPKLASLKQDKTKSKSLDSAVPPCKPVLDGSVLRWKDGRRRGSFAEECALRRAAACTESPDVHLSNSNLDISTLAPYISKSNRTSKEKKKKKELPNRTPVKPRVVFLVGDGEVNSCSSADSEL
ncbi:uncharacterized protein LOC106166352 [Lingula anatina]|uniref:Uncharacterized protein LOC106166352 n=1 Tax=Lingula anatina TaxID=7574 RepID=A0A1S3IQ41_LINAN|nr:uncharacterized protein LOC106166352 [Lingula anatina]|eukprot:XP_013400340.1 uncharacterized protein LOC106166352 [Lingula anatina]